MRLRLHRAALASLLLLPNVGWVAPVAEDGVVLSFVATGDSLPRRAAGSDRVIPLSAGGSYARRLANPADRARHVDVWQLVGTRAERVWTGVVAAGDGLTASDRETEPEGTSVFLVKWSDHRNPAAPSGEKSRARPTDAMTAVMEGERSRVYFAIADDSSRMAAVERLAGRGNPPMRRGRQPAPALEAAFDSSAAARKESFELLLATRGVTRELIGTPNYRALRLVIETVYPAGTALLMYAPSGDTLVTWMITPTGELRRAVQPGLAAGGVALEQLRRALQIDQLQAHRSPRQRGTEPAAPTGAVPHLPQALQAVAEFLLPQELHRALRDVKQLVIVPALQIGTVPFAALPHPAGGQMVDHTALVLAPSICDVIQLGHRVYFDDVARSTMIVGNPHFPAGGAWEFPPLPGAAAEAQAVAQLFGREAITGGMATRAMVDRWIERVSLVYFATHGIASADNPMDGSFLQFAGPSGGGRLTAREIQAYRLQARLAVLSACQTGLGMAHDGGIIGVARSFVNAGSSQVVMSLWNVDDDATQQLMLRFMHHLRAAGPPEALRLAMLDVRESSRSAAAPALWASFTVLGATW